MTYVFADSSHQTLCSPPRPNLVARPRLIERLNSGLHRKLTLISAPAGFGKTTLVSEWIALLGERPEPGVAWLSLDESDSDPVRFLTYLVAALQKLASTIGQSILGMLQSPQPPPPNVILPTLLNDLAADLDNATQSLLLVLDDYHVLDSDVIDQALTFLIDHLPPQLHLVITTREDPLLPLARLRARAQLTEIRAADLRFTPAEAADFLNRAMGLELAPDEIAALERRTEGWIAGLQLAAVSMQGHDAGDHDRAHFIQSFTGSHRFVMDYLLEEVLHQQSAQMQQFLLYTSILDRFCGPLCDAVLCAPCATGQATLEALEQANLFVVPLDHERRWYRYHHLFAELLRQRLQQTLATTGAADPSIEALHGRASQWYEANDLELDAFHHATLANDIARAERLIEGKGMPLHFRGAIRPVLRWLNSLPTTVFDDHPSLWLAHASTLLATGQVVRTQEALQGAELVLEAQLTNASLDDQARDLIGRIAAIRATIAAGLQQVDVIIAQSQRALTYLHPDNLAFRTATSWKLGYAYHLTGDYSVAMQAYQAAIAKSQASGNTIFAIMSLIGLADIFQIEAQLPKAAEYYQRAIALFGEQLLPSAGEAYSGLAQIYYEWNDLEAARHHATQGLQLGRQWEQSDSPIRNEWMRPACSWPVVTCRAPRAN
ncbi:MAG: AAA family ATPase [Caldilineaceae bacterium]